MRGTLLQGVRECLRACQEGNMEMVRFRRGDDVVLEISPERMDGAAIATLSVRNDQDLLRLVHLTLMKDFTREGSVHENVEGEKVHIHFLVPVHPTE